MSSRPVTCDEPSDVLTGKLLNNRSAPYKFGVLCISIGFVFFITGFSTCQWLKLSSASMSNIPETITTRPLFDPLDTDIPFVSIYGLWNGPDDSKCDGTCLKALLVSRVLFTCCLLGYVVSCVLLVLENVRVVNLLTYHSRKVEMALFVTGGLCCGGLFTFNHVFSNSVRQRYSLHFMWSMYLVSLSSTILFIAWLLMICGNKKPGVGVVVPASATVQMAHLSCHTRDHQHEYKPGPSATQQPLLQAPAYPEAPPPYSLPPAYPAPAMPALPPYTPSVSMGP